LLFTFFLHMLPPPPRSTLFPYTTLFRSLNCLSGFRERATRCFVKETTPSTAKDSGGYWLFLRKAGEIGPCAHSCARLISVLPSDDDRSEPCIPDRKSISGYFEHPFLHGDLPTSIGFSRSARMDARSNLRYSRSE